MSDPRYQFQPWYIKAYRWLRYRPKWAIYGALAVWWWFIFYSLINEEERKWSKSRWHYARMIWETSRSMAEAQMQHTWTFEELKERCKTTTSGSPT